MAPTPGTESPRCTGTVTLRILDGRGAGRGDGAELTGAGHRGGDQRLAVRGAPLIGVAAGYGMAMEVARRDADALERDAARLSGARPTARNLAWAVERVPPRRRAAGRKARPRGRPAEAIAREDEAASAALAVHGADALQAALPAGPVAMLTHCNTGALAASGRGTGLGVIAELADRRP